SEFSSEESLASPNKPQAQGYHLPASHVAYLKLKAEAYQKANAAGQKDIAREAGEHLCNEVSQIAKSRLSKKESEALKEGVREWFRQHSMPERKAGKKKTWRVKWHARLVFQHLRSRAIMFVAKALWSEAKLPSMRKLLDKEDQVISRDNQGLDEMAWEGLDEDADDDGDGETGKKSKPFSKYQAATTLLWNALTEAERDSFRLMAEKWRLERPPLEERRRLAEKMGTRQCFLFARDMMKDLDARVYILLAYTNSKGEARGVELEFTEQFGGGEEFRNKFKAELNEGGITELWRQYASITFGPNGEDTATIQCSHKKPLIALEVNGYGEPILPSLLSKPNSIQRGPWLTRVLRAYFTMHYARGTPETRPNVPWKHIRSNVRNFVNEEILPDDKVHLLAEPTSLTADMRQELFLYLRHRQEKLSVKIPFEFHHWMDRKKNFHERSPRKLVEVGSDSDNE
ncbi:hypothetical protein BKA70DRAFT_1054813, partial [Coprinopsis sp. MPI-PUGE-AT-0042]